MKILIAYDGSLNGQTALRYGIRKIKEKGGMLTVLHVFPSNMFIDYGAGPKAEEMARSEYARFVEEARRITEEAGGGFHANSVLLEGTPEDEIIRFARDQHMDLIISAPRYKSIAKGAPCPVAIIPGNILVPVDNTYDPASAIERIISEARAAASRVVLLGIVPIHLYSAGEKNEVERIKKETSAILKKAKKMLDEHEIATKEVIRSGYPDEEILKAAEEYSVSMIIIPEGGETPSELSKAAGILLDESEPMKRPVMLVPSEKVA